VNRRKGVAFVLALLVLVAVGILLAAAGERLGGEMKARAGAEDNLRAEAAARAGVQRALAELSGFNVNLLQPQSDDWAALGDQGNMDFRMGRSSFRLQVVDAGAYVNMNVAPEAQLQNLGLTDEQVDALLDWREAGNAPRPLGAKDEYYNLLPEPYNAKLARLDTLDELLLVKGFTASTLLDPPTNTTSAPLVAGGLALPALVDLATVDSQ
jgi:general secretion pathway protein K